ncbi:MAG TPA: glutamate-cysteine ligase family protein, partial [Polyangia bacterium]
APPLPTAIACRTLLRRHLRELREVATPLGIRFLSGGFRPWGRLDEIPWLPKQRYAIMRDYLPRHGRLGHDMMKRTATVQVNMDFADEADAADKMRVGFGCSSIVTALYAASPITEGRPNGHKTFRAAVWLDMDEARCGLIPAAFEPGFGYRAYAEWAADVPMFFVARKGQYHQVPGLTFRRFMVEGWQGERATMEDWALHLSTVFPEVRLKRTIEMRGADAGPLSFVEGLAALWRGLLDDPEARRAAWELVAKATYQERQELRRAVPRAGLGAQFLGRGLATYATELCDIASAGLARIPGGQGDRVLLEPLAEYARAGRSPADDMLKDFDTHRGNPQRLIEAWQLTETGQ